MKSCFPGLTENLHYSIRKKGLRTYRNPVKTKRRPDAAVIHVRFDTR